jgi:hypothetical protein
LAGQRFSNLIGGEWVAPSTGHYSPNRNPTDADDMKLAGFESGFGAATG